MSNKCKHVKIPNLVYFGSPSTSLSNTNRTIFIYDKLLSIFLNWKVTPIFALKLSIQFSVVKANSGLLYVLYYRAIIEVHYP